MTATSVCSRSEWVKSTELYGSTTAVEFWGEGEMVSRLAAVVDGEALEAAACGHNVRAGGGTGDERGGAQTRSSS